MPLFIGDYLRDTRGLTTEEHGAYLLLLMELWNRDGVLPMDDRYLARVTGVHPRRWPKVWETLSLYFEVRSGRLGAHIEHKRVTAELEKNAVHHARRSNAGKRGAEKKWSKDRASQMALPQQCSGKPEPEPNNKLPVVDVETGGVVTPFPRRTDGER
jgi:uncharacterized protein YdaU (DUF1376 family)